MAIGSPCVLNPYINAHEFEALGVDSSHHIWTNVRPGVLLEALDIVYIRRSINFFSVDLQKSY